MGATEETVVIHCPHCSKKLALGVHYHAPAASCPACHKRFPVPTITAAKICKARAEKLGYRFIDLDAIAVPAAIVDLVPEAIVREDKIVPVAIDGEALLVAIGDPKAQESVDRLRFLLDRPIAVGLATEDAIVSAIDRLYQHPAPAVVESSADQAAVSDVEFVETDRDEEPEAEGKTRRSASAAARERVQEMIRDAFRMGASRVLILPVKDSVKVAYRIQDAVCQRDDVPAEMAADVLVQLMVMVNLHGEIKASLGGKVRRLHAVFRPAQGGLAALIEFPEDPSATERYRAWAARLGYKFVDLHDMPIAPSVLEAVPHAIARQYQVLPIAIDGETLAVVLRDPRAAETLDKLRFILNRPLSVAMAPEGAILAAIDRHYGPADPESADLLVWELAQAGPAPASPAAAATADVASAGRPRGRAGSPPHILTAAVLDHLRTLYRDEMFELFDALRAELPLCRQGSKPENLEVVFPQSHLISALAEEARHSIEEKIWVLREAIISRLENFLEKDELARGIAMTYAQYLACREMAEGRMRSINPATGRDAWINFLYTFALQSFPTIESNGALLGFVTNRLPELSERVASLLDDPRLIVHRQTVRNWIAQQQRQTTADEPIDFDSPPIISLVELLIAEAVHVRAAQMVLLPWQDRIEVAYRVQCTVFARDGLPLRLLYPVLARLAVMATPTGELAIDVGEKKCSLQVRFMPTGLGLAATLRIAPDTAAIQACSEQAAAHGYPSVSLEEVEVPAAILALIPRAVAWKKRILPLAVHGGVLTIVVSDPPGARKLDELRLFFNRPIAIALAPEDDILAAIYRHFHSPAALPAVTPTASAMLQANSRQE